MNKLNFKFCFFFFFGFERLLNVDVLIYLFTLYAGVCTQEKIISVCEKKCRQGVVSERVHLHALVVKCRNNFFFFRRNYFHFSVKIT